jgi:hypothetical protein
MKKVCKKIAVIFALVILLLAPKHKANAQAYWIKSTNNGLYYHTNTSFTWNGSGKAGYCNGYGTIQWYNADGTKSGWFTGNIINGKNQGYGTQYFSNGQKYYEGYWSNDEMTGTGKMYDINGVLQFEGVFENGHLKNMALSNTAAYEAGKYIMRNIFDDGINLRSYVIKHTKDELWFRTQFNGIFINSNVYEFTIAISKNAPYVRIVYSNDLAKLYLTLKAIGTVANEIDNYFNDNN